MKKTYQIRRAAGINWLLDMTQKGYPEYQKPVPLNDSAAYLWNLLQENRSIDELADRLSREQGIAHETALCDIEEFVQQLESRGLNLTGK